MIVLSTPNATNEFHSITVTCTIHPDSKADHCVVMAMADGIVTRRGIKIMLIFTIKNLLRTYTYQHFRHCSNNQWNG